jgi:glycosyltransferase involved in cell wall biosynthesis
MWEQAGFGAGYDIVEASDWGLLLIPPVLEAACAVVVQCHASLGQIAVHDPMAGQETEALLFRLLEGASLSSADVVQTYSHANAAFWRAETSRAVDVLPPALKLPHPEDAVAPSDRCRVLGRLQRWKGPQVVCGALASLGSRAPIVEWYGRDMPWDGRGTSTAEHLAEEFPSVWGRSLSHKSPVAPTEVARLQASAFVNIVPSTWDVFNFTVVESMASGRPTVVSSGAGASELIKDGETGYIFESGSSSSLAAALERVLVAPSEILRGVGDAARASVDKLLSPESVATARLAAYESARGKFASDGCRHVPAWLDAVCRPGQVSQDEFAYLSQVPLREIATHLALRARDKIRPRTPPRRRIARA